jgi:hypothetical protein
VEGAHDAEPSGALQRANETDLAAPEVGLPRPVRHLSAAQEKATGMRVQSSAEGGRGAEHIGAHSGGVRGVLKRSGHARGHLSVDEESANRMCWARLEAVRLQEARRTHFKINNVKELWQQALRVFRNGTEGFPAVTPTCDLVERLKTIPDHRRRCRNLKQRLHDILVLGFCGTLAGCDDFVEIADWATDNAEFFGTFLELPEGIPSHDTFNRVFASVKPAAFQAVLLPWLLKRRACPAGFISMARPCVIPAGTRPD